MISPVEHAVLAAKRGEAVPVVEYLRCSDGLGKETILRELARCLLGASRWCLVFKIRNGRPPNVPGELWQKGNERKVAEKLRLILEQPKDAESFIRELANALDANGTTKWQLVFKRPVGRPKAGPTRKTFKAAKYLDEMEEKRAGSEKTLKQVRPEFEKNDEPSKKFKAARRLAKFSEKWAKPLGK